MTDNGRERGISQPFIEELAGGKLKPILERVRNDDTSSLEIRNGCVDIYYRGGRQLGIHEQTSRGQPTRGERTA